MAYAQPNHEDSCQFCDMSPTVCIVDGENRHETNLCGPCFFGKAQALDEDEWNNLE